MSLMPPPLGPMRVDRVAVNDDAFIRDLLDEMDERVWETTIYERQICDDHKLVFGTSYENGVIILNTPLSRINVATHEVLHFMRRPWAERTVRAVSKRMIHLRRDDQTAAFNETVLAVIHASR
jgi:hypothetical protein